jgi:2,3-bisphosphoglycerate-dependent phosphoglycerate mutase
VAPYWTSAIAPSLAAGENVMVAAHGNSLRAIAKLLFAMDDEAIVGLEIPTGNPLVVDLTPDLKPAGARYLDAERAQALPPI